MIYYSIKSHLSEKVFVAIIACNILIHFWLCRISICNKKLTMRSRCEMELPNFWQLQRDPISSWKRRRICSPPTPEWSATCPNYKREKQTKFSRGKIRRMKINCHARGDSAYQVCFKKKKKKTPNKRKVSLFRDNNCFILKHYVTIVINVKLNFRFPCSLDVER